MKGTFTSKDGVLIDCVVYPEYGDPGTGVKLSALLDTGADLSAVDQDVLRSLQIQTHGVASMTVVMGGTRAPLYLCAFEFAGLPTVSTQHIEVYGVPHESGRLHRAIIGRDILSRAWFTYDGVKGSWTLAAA